MTYKTYQHFHCETDSDGLLWLAIDRKDAKVNSLSAEIFQELDSLISEITQNAPKGVILYSRKPSGFVAGADITQFTQLKDESEATHLVRQAQSILDKLEALPLPTVAMIKGYALGGGCELALACRYRVADNSHQTRIGLPEIKLGIQPGWGGTVRLPKLVGAIKAMGIILPGSTVSANAAKRIGLIDAAVPDRELKRAARYFALQKPTPHHPGIWDRITNWAGVRPLLAKIFYKQLKQKVQRKHYPAPYAVVDNWVKVGVGSKALETEADSISHLLVTPTSRNLVRVFFLQERMKALTKRIDFRPKHIHVVGAGTMGGDIAAWCALRGMRVTLQDRAPEYIAPAIKRAAKLYEKKLKDFRLVQAALDRLQPDVAGEGIARADLIIEAIFENLEAKQKLFKALEEKASPTAVLATNTSSIPLDEINAVMDHPERLVGIHFFNPVAQMPLVEVVKSEKTQDDVVLKALAFVGAIGKQPITVKSSPGFLVNRVLMPYLMEAMELMKEGVSATTIDRVAVDFGMPMGPVSLADTVGLDVCLAVAQNLMAHYGGEIPDKLKDMVERKQLGKKTGAGYYTYTKQGKLVKSSAQDRIQWDPNLIQDRLILRMLNEAVACLREGVIDDKDLLDAGMIFGTGFAPFRGGPIHYTEQRGCVLVEQRLLELQKLCGQRFQPDLGWKTLFTPSAEDERKFSADQAFA